MMINYHIYCPSVFVFILSIITIATIQNVVADASLYSNLQKLKISPEILDDVSGLSQIKIDVHGNSVKPGDPVPARNFKTLDMSKVTWDASEDRYTLLLLDLDRKSGPNNTQNIYNQYTSINIPGNAISLGQAIVAYEPPSVPCQPSTKHRILVLALYQRQNIDISDIAYISASTGQSNRRENFKLSNFLTRHRLDPVAANVFLAIGDANGICSAGTTIHSFQDLTTSILIAMVIVVTAYKYSWRS